jgi:hypothetical protein
MILRKLRVLLPEGFRNFKQPDGRITPRIKKIAIDKGSFET